MNIKESVDYLNFWIKKERGSFYTIEETVQLIDRAQIGLYNDIIQRYATSQIVKDTLEPFKNKYYFTPDTTRSGLIIINDTDYFNLLNCTINYTDTSYMSNSRTSYYGLKLTNEDELGDRLNSQINVPTTIAPVAQELNTNVTINNYQASITFNTYVDISGETIQFFVQDPILNNIELCSYVVSNTITTSDELAQAVYEVLLLNQYGYTMSIDGSTIYVNPRIDLLDSINGVNLSYEAPVDADITLTSFTKISQTLPKLYQIQLYPSTDSYTGTLYYMKRPIKPVYGYTIVGGRQIVYNPETSTQLQWRDTDIDTILLKALSSIGINLSDQEVSQFAELKSSENYQGVNHI
jgi:hypothetical protein